MIRKAQAKDIEAIAAFLEKRVESSMFLLGNLLAYGVDDRTHPHGTSYYLRETGDGINGVFGAANGGFLMCQLPGIGHTEAQTYVHLLKGYVLRAMTGDEAQVSVILKALEIDEDKWAVNQVQPLYCFDLGGLGDVAIEARAPEEGDKALLAEWFHQYAEDTGLDKADTKGYAARADEAIASGRVWILEDRGRPVAMSAVNALAGHTAQIGGVFVRRDRRGEGLAGKLVMAQLAELRDAGISKAILFAASDGAARAYERIGFKRVGDYRVAMLKEPLMLGSQR